MSATFFLTFRGLYVRLTFQMGKTIAETCGRDRATPFISEADAWLAAHQHRLSIQWCEVIPASAALKEAA